MEYNWENYYTEIRTEVHDIRKAAKAISADTKTSLNKMLKELEESLTVIQNSPLEYEVSSSEIARRRVVLDNLKKTVTGLIVNDWSLKPTNKDGDYSKPTTSKFLAVETTNPLTLSDKALIQRQQEVMKKQDSMLEDIEKGVDRLHGQAKEIGVDVRQQTRMIDDLDHHVDIATEGLREEAKHAEEIRRKTNDCYKYVCIVIEVVIIVILLILMFVTK